MPLDKTAHWFVHIVQSRGVVADEPDKSRRWAALTGYTEFPAVLFVWHLNSIPMNTSSAHFPQDLLVEANLLQPEVKWSEVLQWALWPRW